MGFACVPLTVLELALDIFAFTNAQDTSYVNIQPPICTFYPIYYDDHRLEKTHCQEIDINFAAGHNNCVLLMRDNRLLISEA